MKRHSIAVLILFVVTLFAGTSEARHLKLYTYDLADVGTGVSTYSFDYVSDPKEGNAEGDPTLHELEFEYALTKHWMQSLYIDYDKTAAVGNNPAINEVSSVKTEFNINFFEKGQKFVDFRINIELAKAMNNKTDAYGNTDNSDTAEIRLIFEKNFENFSVVLGPMGIKNVSGPGQLGDWEYAYANAIMMDINDKVGFGLEFHGSLGNTDSIAINDQGNHAIVPNFDIALSKETTLSLGAGLPLTDATDGFDFRMAIAYGWKKFW